MAACDIHLRGQRCEWGAHAVVVLAGAGSRSSMAVDSAFPNSLEVFGAASSSRLRRAERTGWEAVRQKSCGRMCLLAPLCPRRHDRAYAERLVVPTWLVSSLPRL